MQVAQNEASLDGLFQRRADCCSILLAQSVVTVHHPGSVGEEAEGRGPERWCWTSGRQTWCSRSMAEVDPRDARIAQLEAMVAERDARIAELMAKVEALTARVAELEARLRQDSSNSLRPPSSDGPGRRRQPKRPTGRRPGGQPSPSTVVMHWSALTAEW